MPVEANASIRVNVPDLKAEIEIECLPNYSFWHLKLCLVDGILSKRQHQTDDRPSSVRNRQSASVDREKRPFLQLVANSLKCRQPDNIGSKSCMPFTTSQTKVTSSSTKICNNASIIRCHSSASSLTSTDTSSGSAFETACSIAQHNNAAIKRSQSRIRVSSSTSPAFYYGFSGVSLYDHDDDNARQSSDLTEDEEAAVRALALATADSNCYAGSDEASTNGNYNEYSTAGICHFLDDHGNLRVSDLDERDEYNVYETLRFNKQPSEDQSYSSKLGDSGNSSVHKNNDDDNTCDKFDENDVKSTNATTNRRLFEQILQSGYLNYGFYSFSLARFIDDQTCLTEYLSLVSTSTGASYYLDLEFKLKQRQQIEPLSSRSAFAPGHDGNAHYSLHLTASQLDSVDRLTHNTNSNNSDIVSLRSNRLSGLNLFHCRIKRTNSISALSTNDSQKVGAFMNLSYQQQQQSFTNNMIAKLASNSVSGGGGSQKPSSVNQASKNSSSSQCKRKRAKMLDLLLNTNWSKQSQQASNLMKLNKVLLVCDTNFLDEKTGESPLSLAITSPQINATTSAAATTNRLQSASHMSANLASIGCSQSASLFDLQYQHPTTNHNQLTLQQTSAADISQSKAPLVEKILLLLVKSGALIDFRNSDGRTPLHIAAMKSNFWALKTLLDLGASTDYRDINGLTPLYYSILHRAELKVTQLLLNNMSNKSMNASYEHNSNDQGNIGSKSIGISDQHGWQEVHQACKLGLDAHLDKLLYYGCDINAKISGSGNTPLHVAAINDQLQAAKVLLLRGADRTITNNSHQTAHQVAVISNNMDLAEFIASHDDAKVVPFSDKSSNLNKRHSFMTPKSYNVNSNRKFDRMSMPPNQQLVNSDSTNTITQMSSCMNESSQHEQKTPTGIVQSLQVSDMKTQNRLDPLTLDVANHHSNGGGSAASSAPSTNTSGTSHQTAQSSLLSINSSGQNQGVATHNISPCLSQRSCGTSNTTTSSGVCCDGDNHNSDPVIRSQNQTSNITIISIGGSAATKDRSNINRICDQEDRRGIHHQANEGSRNMPVIASKGCENAVDDHERILGSMIKPVREESKNCEANEEEDFSSSESSSNGLYSLMSSDRPLFAGSIVEATSDYQSGDPDHLQLRREDLVEVLEYPDDLIRDGQLPRLANKPMLFGRRQSDGTTGLFPSFCVRRTKRRQSSLRQRIPMTDVTNSHNRQQQTRSPNTVAKGVNEQQLGHGIRGTNLPGSQSMAAIGAQQQKASANNSGVIDQPKMSFKEYQVTLTKINEGFGFVLRGAKINPATLAAQSDSGKISIDEGLMIANNLASLQYLDDIELNSVAHQAGLKRGDFLIAVNNQDVRLSSHENVVQMIRSSGDRVHLTIASPIVIQTHYPVPDAMFSSKTLTRIKPEPPKRDPTTTLTRNKTQKVRSMSVAPQIQQQSSEQAIQQGTQFDANKPLPKAPAGYELSSPVNSSNQLNRSISANISHRSTNSLSSVGPDSQSITSISTVGSIDQQKNNSSISSLSSQHQILDQSSSSTTTLTTVATTKPQAPVKPSSIYLKPSAAKNPPDQSTYQSAAVYTSSRGQSQLDSSDFTPPGNSSNNKIPQKNSGVLNLAQVAPPPPPLPPPPPPPLPDFASTPSKNYLANRRTSAPTNQTPSLINDRLLKKRESLAFVSTDNNTNPSNGAAPICTVAAACAAAANSRLQRQQQKQQEEIGQKDARVQNTNSNQSVHVAESPSRPKDTVTKKDIDERNQPGGTATNCSPCESAVRNGLANEHVSVDTPKTTNPASNRDSNMRLVQSATLGRKSSAQIIQQPKQNSCVTHSQTLRAVAAPKRMSILDYEMPPPPPPPTLPPQQAFVEQRRQVNAVYQEHDQVSRQQQHHHRHYAQHNQHQHRNQNHQQKRSEDCCNHQLVHEQVPVNRFQQEIGEQQLQNQHQMIIRQQQQMRQQQILQDRLAAQQQCQQKVCQHFHSAIGHDYGAAATRNSIQLNDLLAGQNEIDLHQHQKANGVIDALKIHPSRHQQLQNHDTGTTPVITQQQQQYHKHNHRQHHHHHHNHHRQTVAPAQHSQDASVLNHHHHHHHKNHTHHDHQHQHLQQQRILQQQQHNYMPCIDSNHPYLATTLNR